MADAITRVGLTAKRGLGAASGVLAELAGWLEARDVHPVSSVDGRRVPGPGPVTARVAGAWSALVARTLHRYVRPRVRLYTLTGLLVERPARVVPPLADV